MLTATCFKDALLDGAREVFETMVFMALAEAQPDGPEIGETALLSSITFKGDLEGCLTICCGETCAQTIAANMLGTGPGEQIPDNGVSDALGEMANMVMGAVKSRVQGDIGRMEVSIPSVVQGRELRNSMGERAQRVVVRVNIEEQYGAEMSLMYREVEPDGRK